ESTTVMVRATTCPLRGAPMRRKLVTSRGEAWTAAAQRVRKPEVSSASWTSWAKPTSPTSSARSSKAVAMPKLNPAPQSAEHTSERQGGGRRPGDGGVAAGGGGAAARAAVGAWVRWVRAARAWAGGKSAYAAWGPRLARAVGEVGWWRPACVAGGRGGVRMCV